MFDSKEDFEADASDGQLLYWIEYEGWDSDGYLIKVLSLDPPTVVRSSAVPELVSIRKRIVNWANVRLGESPFVDEAEDESLESLLNRARRYRFQNGFWHRMVRAIWRSLGN